MTHALRDCLTIKDLWKMLVNLIFWAEFFRGDITEWFIFNSKREVSKLHSPNWKLAFREAVCRIWLNRNNWVFRNEDGDIANFYWNIIVAAKEFEENSKTLIFSDLVRNEASIAWQPSTDGWDKCNVGGSSREGGEWTTS